MIKKLQMRLKSDEGFTLIELLVVIIIIGILLAIAIPSYLSFKSRANDTAAKSDINAAVPAMEAYNSDQSGSYAGADLTKLKGYDAGIKGVKVMTPTASSYCLESTVGGATWHQKFGTVATTPDPNPVSGPCT